MWLFPAQKVILTYLLIALITLITLMIALIALITLTNHRILRNPYIHYYITLMIKPS